MLAAFTRSSAIFFVLVLSFFAAASANAQSAADRLRSASASSETPSDGSASAAFSSAYAIRANAVNPVTWMEQCAARLSGAPTAFALSLRQELQPAENDIADERGWSSRPAACEPQQFFVQRAAPLSASAKPVTLGSLPVIAPDADHTSAELASLGKPGAAIAHARAIVLEILGSENACTEWYRTKDSAPARTFQSLTYSIDRHGQQTIFQSPLPNFLMLFRQPYVARATQDGGPFTEITVNANGAFFRQQATIEKFPGDGGPGLLAGSHLLTVGYYSGETLEAQAVTLLHEFGHILDLLPPDSDDLDGSSARNTDQVLRHCRPEVEAFSKQARQSAKK